MTLVFGIGIGLFIILTLWVIAALIFIISLRIEKKIGAIAILTVILLTIVLISVPRSSEKSSSNEKKIYDHLFVWRIVLLTLLIISSIIGLFGFIKFGLIEPVRPVRITTWVY